MAANGWVLRARTYGAWHMDTSTSTAMLDLPRMHACMRTQGGTPPCATQGGHTSAVQACHASIAGTAPCMPSTSQRADVHMDIWPCPEPLLCRGGTALAKPCSCHARRSPCLACPGGQPAAARARRRRWRGAEAGLQGRPEQQAAGSLQRAALRWDAPCKCAQTRGGLMMHVHAGTQAHADPRRHAAICHAGSPHSTWCRHALA